MDSPGDRGSETLSERIRRASFSARGGDRNRDRNRIQLKSLILAQIERWRHALHMQVERERGQPQVEWRTGE
jgi:hypothetical protein